MRFYLSNGAPKGVWGIGRLPQLNCVAPCCLRLCRWPTGGRRHKQLRQCPGFYPGFCQPFRGAQADKLKTKPLKKQTTTWFWLSAVARRVGNERWQSVLGVGLFSIIPIITTALVQWWLCGAALIICIMLFSLGPFLQAGFLFCVAGLLFALLSGQCAKRAVGTKSMTVKPGRRAGVGSAAKRPGEPNSFFIGGVGFLQHGILCGGFPFPLFYLFNRFSISIISRSLAISCFNCFSVGR